MQADINRFVLNVCDPFLFKVVAFQSVYSTSLTETETYADSQFSPIYTWLKLNYPHQRTLGYST